MRKLILVSIILLAVYTTHVSAEVGDLLMSTSYKSLDAGESWNLEEGYALTIKQINIEGTKIWLSLSKYNSEVDSKVLSNGETYVYGKEIGSKEYTILRATVGEIDKESRTVRLDSVRQYFEGGAAAVPTTSTKADAVPMAQKTLPTSGSSGNIPKLIFPSNGDIMNDGRVGNQVWDFDWTDVEGASEYQLYVKKDTAESPIINTITASSYYQRVKSGSVVLPKNYYGWTAKVRAKVNGQWSEWSEARNFQVGPTPTAFQPTPVTTPQQIATTHTPSTTRYATPVVTLATSTSQQNKTSNTTLIFGGTAILIVLVLLVGKSRRKGQKAPGPTSAPKPNSDAKRSQNESKAYLEWLMEVGRLQGETSEALLEKDPEKTRKMIDKISVEHKELFKIHKNVLDKGASFPSKDTRLKEAKSIIQDAEADLQDAMNKGVQIPQSVQRLLQDAQKEVEAGHLATAKEYASKCSEKVNAAVKDFMQRKAEQARKQRELEQMRKGAFERIKSANKSIEKAEWLGITIKHAKELNAKAQSAFDANDYSNAITYANQSTDAAKKLIDESKPSISIELPSKMEYDTWKHRDLTVTNAGTAHAIAITITFLTALEVRELGTIKKLGVGEQKTLNVNIRPTEKGEVPFDYSIGFRDLIDRDYKTKDTINLQIGTGVESLEGGADMPTSNLEIKRTVYDPVNKGFVSENKLNYPEVERWVESHPPPNYWYILRIENTSSSVEEWAVELETHLALSVKEAYIEGIDRKFDIRSEHDRYKEKHILAVLKEYGIPLPSNGVKRLYFRLNIDCATALLSKYAISGRVIANDVTLPIPEKNFPFSCELREIQAALAKDPEGVENYVKGTAEGRYDHKTVIAIVNALRLYNEINDLVMNKYVDEEKLKNKIENLRENLKTVEDQTGVKKPLELVEYILDDIMPRSDVHVTLNRWKAMNLFDVMMIDLLKVRT